MVGGDDDPRRLDVKRVEPFLVIIAQYFGDFQQNRQNIAQSPKITIFFKISKIQNTSFVPIPKPYFHFKFHENYVKW